MRGHNKVRKTIGQSIRQTMRYSARVVLVAGCFVTVKSRGQSSTLILPSNEGQSVLRLPDLEAANESETRTQITGQIRMESMDYLTPLPQAPQLTYSHLLSARLNAVREAPRYDLGTDVAAGTFFSVKRSNFFVNEAYASYKTEPVKIYVGRKKFEWSDVDRRWQLGMWQPRQALDTLRPEEQGLSGVFFDHASDNFEILGLASPLFIPTMTPEVREEDGALVADSRWYRQPTSEYNFNNRINSISYKLDIPTTERLTNNHGGALMVRAGNKESGPWLVMSGGYMPVNDLILKRRIFKAIAQDQVDVTVAPEVTHHTITSADLGYSFENARFTLSYLQDRPDVKTAETDWAIQRLSPLQAYSASFDFSVDDIFSRSFSVQLSYMKTYGGGIEDITADGSVDDITLFDQRLKFTHAAAVQVEGQLVRLFHRPLVTRFRYLYDYDQRGSLLMTEFLYYPSHKWAVVAGADILGVADESYRPTSFLNQYRANDRIYGGATYVF